METSLETPLDRKTTMTNDIYLDYNATTPVDPEVFQAMEPYFKHHFGNPASAGHHWGWAADNAVSKARSQVASLIEAKPSEVIFTGGATESNNWVIFGLIAKIREENPNEPIHMLTSCIEHSSIMKCLNIAKRMGIEVDFLPVTPAGTVDIDTVRCAIKPHTKLMSFIWVNNEIGSINPMKELGQLAKEKKIYLHTDATQAVGKIPVSMSEVGVDLMSFSGHKIYGPKGVGALYIRSKDPKVQICPLIYGGGQERGLRSGTLNVPGIVGLGKASEICQAQLIPEMNRLKKLQDIFWAHLQESIPGIRLNGSPTMRSPSNLNVTLPGVKTEQILPGLQRLGVSTGSACGTGSMVLSHVLQGLGLSIDEIQCSLRLSTGRWTTEKDVVEASAILKKALLTAK